MEISPDINEYVLTADEQAAVNEIKSQLDSFRHQLDGAIRTLARIHGLSGAWDFKGDKFLRVQATPAAQPLGGAQ